jgi:hypothetical protein
MIQLGQGQTHTHRKEVVREKDIIPIIPFYLPLSYRNLIYPILQETLRLFPSCR